MQLDAPLDVSTLQIRLARILVAAARILVGPSVTPMDLLADAVVARVGAGRQSSTVNFQMAA